MSPKTIILYTSPQCRYCDDVDVFLDAFFLKRKNPHNIITKDISNERNYKSLAAKLGGQIGVPALDTGGTLLIGSDNIIEWFKKNT